MARSEATNKQEIWRTESAGYMERKIDYNDKGAQLHYLSHNIYVLPAQDICDCSDHNGFAKNVEECDRV